MFCLCFTDLQTSCALGKFNRFADSSDIGYLRSSFANSSSNRTNNNNQRFCL